MLFNTLWTVCNTVQSQTLGSIVHTICCSYRQCSYSTTGNHLLWAVQWVSESKACPKLEVSESAKLVTIWLLSGYWWAGLVAERLTDPDQDLSMLNGLYSTASVREKPMRAPCLNHINSSLQQHQKQPGIQVDVPLYLCATNGDIPYNWADLMQTTITMSLSTRCVRRIIMPQPKIGSLDHPAVPLETLHQQMIAPVGHTPVWPQAISEDKVAWRHWRHAGLRSMYRWGNMSVGTFFNGATNDCNNELHVCTTNEV